MLDLQIREQIAGYVAGEIEAPELENWLEDQAWDLEEDPARQLAAEALRLLAEWTNGDWPENELRARLGDLSRTYWFDQAPRVAWSGSGSPVMRHQEQSEAAGRWHAVGSA